MSKKYLLNSALALFSFIVTLCLVELACLAINRASGESIPFFYNKTLVLRTERGHNQLHSLDSLLGYTYAKDDASKEHLTIPFVFQDGFVIFTEPPQNGQINFASLPRPIIVTLGGSTTESFRWETSWPQELATLLRKEGFPGTVVNGGIGGYSSNQELLKSLRDVLEINPDIVIAFHGVNELAWVKYPYPLVSKYMRNILETMVNNARSSTFLPNTYFFLSRVGKKQKTSVTEISHGVPNPHAPVEVFLRNDEKMRTLYAHVGIHYVSILQPFALTGTYAEALKQSHPDFVKEIVAENQELKVMYGELLELKTHTPFAMLDYTDIFSAFNPTVEQIFLDRCHVTPKANQFLAKQIFNEIRQHLEDIAKNKRPPT